MSHLGRVTVLAVLNALFLAPSVAAQEDDGGGGWEAEEREDKNEVKEKT